MTGRAYYLIGAPGVGKSTVMQGLLAPWMIGEYVRFTEREMFGHQMVQRELKLVGAYLGHLRPEFPGTDALSMSVQPQALGWLRRLNGGIDYIYGEGARLANFAFIRELSLCYKTTLVHLTASPEVLDLRVLGRPDGGEWKTGRDGRGQDRKWQDGQAQRAANLAKTCLASLGDLPNLEVIEIDTTDATPGRVVNAIVGAEWE